MGYYAIGNGSITFKEILSEEKFTRVRDTLAEELECDGVRIPGPRDVGLYSTYFDIWGNEKYYGEEVEACLHQVAEIADIESGEIRYVGEDDCFWRFFFKNGEWIEENGTIFYDSEIKDLAEAILNEVQTPANKEVTDKIKLALKTLQDRF